MKRDSGREHDKRQIEKDYIKANRKGNREAYREINGDGFKSYSRVEKSKKNYSRKGKNKFFENDDSSDW